MLETLNQCESKKDVRVNDQDLLILSEVQLVLIGGGSGQATLE